MSRLVKVRKKRRKVGTNYRKRKELLKSGMPRIVVRKSNKYIIAQIIISKEAQDKTVAYATSKELSKFGWKHSLKCIPAAYLTGILLGSRINNMKDKNLNKISFIVDTGLHRITKNSKLFVVVKGFVDAGLSVRHKIEPNMEGINGHHISKGVEGDMNQIKNSIIKNINQK